MIGSWYIPHVGISHNTTYPLSEIYCVHLKYVQVKYVKHKEVLQSVSKQQEA